MPKTSTSLNIGVLKMKESATPATPPSGYGFFWLDTSGDLHWMDDAGVDTNLGSGVAHDILSSGHGDALAAAVSRGSIIYGNATPKWAELNVGAANTVLKSDGTDVAWNTPTHATAAWHLTGDISPTQITGDQNDYNPTGLSTASVLRLNLDTDHSLTGLAGGADGRIVVLINIVAVGSPGELTLVNQSASSSAANRFMFAGNASITLRPASAVALIYDSTSSRWRSLSRWMVTLTSDVSGVLSIANGGTNLATYARGDIVRASAANVLAALGIGAYPQILRVDSGSDDPEWTHEYLHPIDSKTAETQVVSTTSMTTLFTEAIPAGKLGTTGWVHLLLLFNFKNNSGSPCTFTWQLEFGATTIVTTGASGSNSDSATVGFGVLHVLLKADGATNAQKGGISTYGVRAASNINAVAGYGTAAEDSTLSKTLIVKVQPNVSHAQTYVTALASRLTYLPAI